MNRQRILLLENDGALQGVLCDLFGYEDLDVTVCNSLAELQAGVKRYPFAAVVSDSWARGDFSALSPSIGPKSSSSAERLRSSSPPGNAGGRRCSTAS